MWDIVPRGRESRDIRSLENARGNLNRPFLGHVAAIEKYREKSRKENRQSRNRESGYRESHGQEVLATWNHKVRNPDKVVIEASKKKRPNRSATSGNHASGYRNLVAFEGSKPLKE
jgi:hypothetical protein